MSHSIGHDSDLHEAPKEKSKKQRPITVPLGGERPEDGKNVVSVIHPNLSWGPVGLACFIGIVGTFVVHGLMVGSDRQRANIFAGAFGSFAVIFVLVMIHRRLVGRIQKSWARYVVAGASLFCVLLHAAVYRFDGFSGELWPQFTPRWQSFAPIQTEADLGSQDFNSEVSGMISFLDAHPSSSSTTTPDVEDRGTDGVKNLAMMGKSSQFLGNNRNGTVLKREFSVPKSTSDVKRRWEIGVGQGWSAFAVADQLAVTLEQREQKECLTAYRLEDGKLIWIISREERFWDPIGGPGPRSTPTIFGDRVFAQSATGWVTCAELATGREIWSVDLIRDIAQWDHEQSEDIVMYGRAGSPLVVGNQVIVPLGGPENASDQGRSLVSLDSQSGRVLWRSGEDQISYASPMLFEFDGDEQIVIANEDTVTGHRVSDGVQLWTFPWPGRSDTGPTCASAIPAGKNRFLVGKGYDGGSSLVEVQKNGKRWSAEEIWHEDHLLETKFNHAIYFESKSDPFVFGIGNGMLECVELSEPKRIWRQGRRQRTGQGHILLADDVIIAQCEYGAVQFIAANESEFQLLFELPALETKSWNIPTLVGNLLLVRNDRQAICFELPKR